MNNRGFTLVELLATIAILGLVLGIASYGVIGAINNSKMGSEKVFVSKVSDLIQSYLALNGSSMSGEEILGDFKKCRVRNNEGKCSDSDSYQVKLFKLSSFELSDATSSVPDDKFINPATKKKCSKNVNVDVFRDSDYVYYYCVKLSDCDISSDNEVINTLPSDWELSDCELGLS